MSDDLASVGERAALARIIPRLGGATALLGPGDDAAILAAPDGRVLLSTDVMVQGPDFRTAWSTPRELGWKAVATNLIDIAAMGARPTGLLVALTAPGSTAVATLEGIADGMREACARLAPGVGVVGGDLTMGPVLSLAVSVAGSLDGRAPVLRSGARPGETVAYAGRLGAAAAALRLLFAIGEEDPEALAVLRRDHGALLAQQLAPTPPVEAGVVAADAGASAMLDVSDGLLLDASRLAEASDVVIDLESARLQPDVDALPPDLDGLALVLSGGEDHGLLACFPGAVPAPFRPIGVVRAGPPSVRLDGGPPPALSPGWDSFTTS